MTGAVKINGRFIHFGVKGAADLSGIIKCGGIRLEIEVKSGGAVQTAEQKNYEKMIKDFGGIYILARDRDDAVNKLQEVLRLRGVDLSR